MRIAISTDSGSGISQEESRNLGIAVVPMPFSINGKDYYEDVNITQEIFYDKLKNEECDLITSQPSPEYVMKVWDQLLEDNDMVVHIPITSGLSGSTQTALMLSQEDKYEGKVFVTDSKGVSVTQKHQCMQALELANRGVGAEEIRDILNRDAERNSIYIALDTLKYLKKGGRITPMAAAIGTMLKIKPVLTIVNGGNLDSYAKVRTTKQVRETMIAGLQHDLATKFNDPEAKNCGFGIAYTDDVEVGLLAAKEIEELFPNRGIKKIEVNPLSLLVSSHIGPGAIGYACYEIAPELRK